MVLNPEFADVFLLKEGFWGFYLNHDGFQNLGAPSSDEETGGFVVDGELEPDVTVQLFEKHALVFKKDGFDKTKPYTDGITVVDHGGQSRQAFNTWSIEEEYGEGIDLYQNGDYLCTTPCNDVYRVKDWRYTTTTPNQKKYFNMVGIWYPMSLERFVW